MPWVRFDDATADHPKFSALQDYAPLCGWLWFSACCYCMRYLTDGRIDLPALRRLWPHQHISMATGGVGDGEGSVLAEFCEDPTVEDLVKLLVSSRLLDELEPGLYRVHDFLKYNPSKRQVVAARKENTKRQQRFRGIRRNAVTNGATNAAVILPPSPSPSPTTKARVRLDTTPRSDLSISGSETAKILEARDNGTITTDEARSRLAALGKVKP